MHFLKIVSYLYSITNGLCSYTNFTNSLYIYQKMLFSYQKNRITLRHYSDTLMYFLLQKAQQILAELHLIKSNVCY